MSPESLPHLDAVLAELDWLQRFASELLADQAAAEDVAQQTLLAALEARLEPGLPLRPWLRSVARNFAYQSLRRGAARAGIPYDPPTRSETLPADALVIARESKRAWVERVKRLSAPNRDAVLLRYYLGLSCERIARRLSCPVATVRSRLKRALAELRLGALT